MEGSKNEAAVGRSDSILEEDSSYSSSPPLDDDCKLPLFPESMTASVYRNINIFQSKTIQKPSRSERQEKHKKGSETEREREREREREIF